MVAYYAVDYVKNVKGTNYWRNRVLKVGKEYSGFNLAVSDKSDFQQELSEFGLEHVAGDKPVVTARQGGLKYKMTEEFSMETLKDFLTQLEAGNVDPWIKSGSDGRLPCYSSSKRSFFQRPSPTTLLTT